MHDRFNRIVLVSRSELLSDMAARLVDLSPYNYPANLTDCLDEFNEQLITKYQFDITNSMDFKEIDLRHYTHEAYELIENCPSIVSLNEPKNGSTQEHYFSSRYSQLPDPDDDFIDLMALAQNLTVCLADRADASEYLDKDFYEDSIRD